MKLKNIALFALCALVCSTLVACDDFLEKEPSKSTNKTLQSTDQLDALLGNYSNFYRESVVAAYPTDDWGIEPEMNSAKSGGVFNATSQLPYILWSDEVDDSRYSVWAYEYKKIYFANVAIENAMSLQGTDEDKANLKAEGHFLRAYSMFNLAVAHTLYFDGSNGDDQGLSLQMTTFEDSNARANLADTWAQIDGDIQEALKITVPFEVAGTNRVWRATTASVNAFAARYYLYRGDYTNAKSYAQKALQEYNTLRDLNNYRFSGTVETYETNEGTITVYYPLGLDERISGAAAFGSWFETEGIYLARQMYSANWWFVPSKDLEAVYEVDVPAGDSQNDLRYRYFFVEDFSLNRGCSKDPAYHWSGLMHNYYESLDAGPSVAEMMLIVAECEARNGSYQTALSSLTPLRAARVVAGEADAPTRSVAGIELTASSKEEAIKKILQERRREMPMTARLYDLKRLNANDPANKVTITRQFYDFNPAAGTVITDGGVKTYTMEPGSRHYAIPIPKTEIANGKGTIEQNIY